MSETSRWTDDQQVAGKYEVKQPSAAGSLKGSEYVAVIRACYGFLKDI